MEAYLDYNSTTPVDLAVFEATVGFRASREVTLRSSYYARRFYGSTDWVHQAGVAGVWARRWW